MAWTVISAFVLDQILGYQGMNKVKDNLITLASRRGGRHLGGSRTIPVFGVLDDNEGEFESVPPGLGPHDAPDAVDIEIDQTLQGGITYQARVEVRTRWPGCSITPKIRNVTDGTDAVVGAACVATNADYSGTNQKQTLAIVLAAGIKKYRLQFTLGAVGLGFDAWIIGELEAFTTA